MSPVVRYCHRHHTTSPGRCPACTTEKQHRLDVHRNPAGQRFRQAILERDGHRCHWCGGPGNTVDYLTALADGGAPYEPGNAVCACKPCNSRRGAALVNGGVVSRNATRISEPATFSRVSGIA